MNDTLLAKQQVELPFGALNRKVAVGDVVYLAKDAPFALDCGTDIQNFPLAYRTYGQLNADKTNAIFICHGLTGDQYVADTQPVTDKEGWWNDVVGPDKVIDTNRYFVICSNVLGGCMGSYGPKSPDPETGKPLGLNFPVVTVGDMVRAQRLLVEHLGIDKLYAVIGGSMGGMLALEWLAHHHDKLRSAIIVATAARHCAQNIAFHEIGRQAVMADPDWQNGMYNEHGTYPSRGLAVARMTAHVTYLSQQAMQHKFGRGLQSREKVSYGFEADFQVESYLRYQGKAFVDRFDANSYLYITRAMDYFDLAEQHGGQLRDAFKGVDARVCVISFSSDWLFTTQDSRDIVRALNMGGARVSFAEVATDKGHDAFLMDEPEFHMLLKGFLQGGAEEAGL
ncbi:MAG: homoserine O-acetyltransferase [Alphaproteobacteria bacterium]|nr:homoserine O-acetyltransferase [Alphaproteobacteria bacterium]